MRVKKIGLLATTVFVSAMVAMSGTAMSQEATGKGGVTDRKMEEYTAQGLPAGSFRLFPVVKATAISDDNIYKEQTGENSDWITKVEPSFSLRSDWNRHSLRVDAGGAIANYKDNSADDYNTIDLRVRGQADISRALNLTGEARHRTLSEARGGSDVATDAASPVDGTEQTIAMGASYKPNRIGLSVDGEMVDYNFDDNLTIAGATTNNDDRDRKDTIGSLKVSYDIQDGYIAYVRGEKNERNYSAAIDDAGVNRDSDGYKLQAGLAVDLSRLVRADIAVGTMSQSYTATTLKDVSGWSGDANIRWNITQLTTIKLNLSRTIGETTSSGVSSTVGTNYGIGVDHELRRNIILKAGIKMSNSDYQGTTRSDDIQTLSAGVDYKLNRNFFAGVGVSKANRDSSVAGNDYDNTQLMLNVGAQF